MAMAFAATLSSQRLSSAQSPPSPQSPGQSPTPPPDSEPTTASQNADDPALRSFHAANGMLQRGMHDLAAAEYRRFLDGNADHAKAPVARYGLGVCLFRLKQYNEAAEQLVQISNLQDFEFGAETGLLLGQCQLIQEKFAEAAATFDRIPREHSGHELVDDAAALRVEALYRGGDLAAASQAASDFDNAWPEHPQRERVDLFAGMAEMNQNHNDAAAERFAALVQRYPKGQFADRAAYLLAQSLHRAGRDDEAIAAYRAVLGNDKTSYAPDAQLGLAVLLMARDDDAEAAKLLDRLLESSSKDDLAPRARFERARICFDSEEYERAIEFLRAAVNSGYDQPDAAAYWIGKSLLRQEKHAEAAAALNEAIEKYPDSSLQPEMRYDLAVAKMRSGDGGEAVAGFNNFRSQFPDHDLAGEALHLQASLEHQAGNYDASLALCREFMRKHASHDRAPQVAFVLAENEFLAGRMTEAAAAYASLLQTWPEHPQHDDAVYRLGSAHYRLDDFEAAEPQLAKVVTDSMDSRFAPALLMLGEIRFRAEDWAGAEQHYRRYLDSVGDDEATVDDAMLKLSLAMHRQERLDDAIGSYTRLIERDANKSLEAHAYFERGQARLTQQDYDDAAADFNQVLQSPEGGKFKPYALNHLGQIALVQGNHDQAAELFDQLRVADGTKQAELGDDALFFKAQACMASKKYEDATQALQAFLADHANDARAVQARGQLVIAMARQDQHEQALEVCKDFDLKSLAAVDAPLAAAVAYERAWCLRELDRDDEARQAYRDMLELPGDAAIKQPAMLELAELDAAAGDTAASAEILEQLRQNLRASDDSATDSLQQQALWRLGRARFQLEQYEPAASLFEEYLKGEGADDDRAAALFYAGESRNKLGQHPAAAEHFAALVQKYPDHEAAAAGLLRLGESLSSARKFDESEQRFRDYLQKYPESESWFQAQFGIGWALENQEKHDQAIAAYQKVVERHQGPTAARAQFQIGECLYGLRKYDEAVRELLKVDILYAYPEWSAAALFEAGRCFEALEKPQEARAQYELVRERFPDSRWAEMAGEKLRSQANAARTDTPEEQTN
jgi:TolA-binding protein